MLGTHEVCTLHEAREINCKDTSSAGDKTARQSHEHHRAHRLEETHLLVCLVRFSQAEFGLILRPASPHAHVLTMDDVTSELPASTFSAGITHPVILF